MHGKEVNTRAQRASPENEANPQNVLAHMVFLVGECNNDTPSPCTYDQVRSAIPSTSRLVPLGMSMLLPPASLEEGSTVDRNSLVADMVSSRVCRSTVSDILAAGVPTSEINGHETSSSATLTTMWAFERPVKAQATSSAWNASWTELHEYFVVLTSSTSIARKAVKRGRDSDDGLVLPASLQHTRGVPVGKLSSADAERAAHRLVSWPRKFFVRVRYVTLVSSGDIGEQVGGSCGKPAAIQAHLVKGVREKKIVMQGDPTVGSLARRLEDFFSSEMQDPTLRHSVTYVQDSASLGMLHFGEHLRHLYWTHAASAGGKSSVDVDELAFEHTADTVMINVDVGLSLEAASSSVVGGENGIAVQNSHIQDEDERAILPTQVVPATSVSPVPQRRRRNMGGVVYTYADRNTPPPSPLVVRRPASVPPTPQQSIAARQGLQRTPGLHVSSPHPGRTPSQTGHIRHIIQPFVNSPIVVENQFGSMTPVRNPVLGRQLGTDSGSPPLEGQPIRPVDQVLVQTKDNYDDDVATPILSANQSPDRAVPGPAPLGTAAPGRTVPLPKRSHAAVMSPIVVHRDETPPLE